MRKLLLLLSLISSQALASTCFMPIENHRYELQGGAEYCIEANYQYVKINNSGSIGTTIELSDYKKENYAIAYSGEAILAPDVFYITSFTSVDLTIIDGNVYIEDAQPLPTSYSTVSAVIKSIKDGDAGAIGASLGGGDPQLIPTLVGGGIGAVVGSVTHPVVGNIIGSAITHNIINGQGKPKPPLTKINTKKGIKGSWSNSRWSLSGHSHGGSRTTCRGSCHNGNG